MKTLLTEAIAGDEVAMNQLIKENYNDILLTARTYLNCVCDAEDCTQEIFIKLPIVIKNYDPAKAEFRTWLQRIAKNHLINFSTKKKMEYFALEVDNIDEAHAKRFITIKEIKQIIEKYDLACMVFMDGSTYKEVAKELGICLTHAFNQTRAEMAALTDEIRNVGCYSSTDCYEEVSC
jgi:RNA polymerase sigma factor (sigma-70 family)